MHAIDCDVHPTIPGMSALLPYLDPFWRESVVEREISSLESISYPVNAPITARPDWKNASGRAAVTADEIGATVFGRWGADAAILNCLYGVQLVFNEDMANAFARALNDYIVHEFLERDARLRASIVLPVQNVEMAVAELERCAADKRFVQVLLLAMGESPLGRRMYWPIYEAAQRHGLPIGIHAGSNYRNPVTSLGWPTYYAEDYAAQSLGFQSQVASLVCEGVFVKYPQLKVVLLESGVSWLPGFMWRLSKFWRGVRMETPWIDRSPFDIVRDHVRLTVQPYDGPDDLAAIEKSIDHFQSDDMLLFASDFPHWQFDGDETMPRGIPERLHRKIRVDNPLATYSRLAALAQPAGS
ncbi:MAG: TIM-barrel fold metal-dependent hydrolase [Hyphomicrobiales bacterium]|nr:TIM-barrel fold metal-dependent hydrolase [Hyphomicrobiales bacterium]